MAEVNGFDAAARQWFCETTVEGLDLGLEAVLFRAIVAGDLPVDQVCASLERWIGLCRDGYFDIVSDDEGGEKQVPVTAEGRNFREKLLFLQRLLDGGRNIDEGRQ